MSGGAQPKDGSARQRFGPLEVEKIRRFPYPKWRAVVGLVVGVPLAWVGLEARAEAEGTLGALAAIIGGAALALSGLLLLSGTVSYVFSFLRHRALRRDAARRRPSA